MLIYLTVNCVTKCFYYYSSVVRMKSHAEKPLRWHRSGKNQHEWWFLVREALHHFTAYQSDWSEIGWLHTLEQTLNFLSPFPWCLTAGHTTAWVGVFFSSLRTDTNTPFSLLCPSLPPSPHRHRHCRRRRRRYSSSEVLEPKAWQETRQLFFFPGTHSWRLGEYLSLGVHYRGRGVDSKLSQLFSYLFVF